VLRTGRHVRATVTWTVCGLTESIGGKHVRDTCAVTRYHVQYRLLDSHVRHRSEGKYTYLPVTPKPVRYNLAVQDSVSDTSDVYGQ